MISAAFISPFCVRHFESTMSIRRRKSTTRRESYVFGALDRDLGFEEEIRKKLLVLTKLLRGREAKGGGRLEAPARKGE